MKKKEFAVGEVFQFGLKKLKVVEDDDVIVRWAYLEDILPLPCKEGDKHE